MKFYDDEPKECDCGCTVYAGDCYFTLDFKLVDDRNKKIKRVHLTSCSDEDCMAKVLQDFFAGSWEEHYINTAEDNEADYGDMKCHENR